jgi:hypothetical protein
MPWGALSDRPYNHPHCRSSVLELNGIMRGGKQYLSGSAGLDKPFTSVLTPARQFTTL